MSKCQGGDPWLRWFRRVLPLSNGFEGQRYLAKWLFVSTTIGVVAGLGAIAFTFAIEFVTHVALGRAVGYLPPSPIGEGTTGVLPILRPWLLPLVTALGGLLSGVIVFTLAPEAEGHGTDAAIDAIHRKRGDIRARIPPIKLVASAITIGTGGSGGREGPTAQISAGFGSLLGQWLDLNTRDRRIAVAVGMGAGIGAIFRAPLGGAVMAAEILYVHDLEVEALIPTLIASIIGYSIYGTIYGYIPIFGDQARLGFTHPLQLLYYAMLGVVSGLGGLLYDKSFYGMTAVFHRLTWPRWVKPAFGGLLVGLLGLVLPGVLHTGYGWVQISMSQALLGLPLWGVLLLPFAKILTTSLSIGSGGSGGIFGPGMVIGGMLGASFWRLSHGVFPHMPVGPAPFVIIGMMALFGGIAHAPLAVMLMVAEMTGNLSLLAPAMVAVAISTALVGDHTIYRSQLRTRADLPGRTGGQPGPLSRVPVSAVMRRTFRPIASRASFSDVINAMTGSDEAICPVVDDEGRLAGVISSHEIQTAITIPDAELLFIASDLANLHPPLLLESDTLDHALQVMIDSTLEELPVVDESASHRVVGMLGRREVLAAYHRVTTSHYPFEDKAIRQE